MFINDKKIDKDGELKKYFISCECESPEHILVVNIDYDPEVPFVGITNFLNVDEPWYKRIWIALKYVFGCRKNGNGHFSETIFGEEDVKSLRDLLNNYLKQFDDFPKPPKNHTVLENGSRYWGKATKK